MAKPEHMDIGSRNARLCETFKGMGLYVQPIFAVDDPDRIDYMHISAGLPSQVSQGVSQDASGGPIAAPMTRPQVRENIKSTKRQGADVINFPSKHSAGKEQHEAC